MKNNKNNTNKIYLSLAVFIVLGISLVSAFSVSSPYMGNKELHLFSDSGTTDLEYVLQNGGGATEDVNIKVDILEGSGIIAITDESNIYTVSPGDKIPVHFRITLPEDVIAGNTYNIKLEFNTVTGESGTFGFGTGQEQTFKVVIDEQVLPEKETKGALLYIILGILIVLIVVVLVLIKRKNKK